MRSIGQRAQTVGLRSRRFIALRVFFEASRPRSIASFKVVRALKKAASANTDLLIMLSSSEVESKLCKSGCAPPFCLFSASCQFSHLSDHHQATSSNICQSLISLAARAPRWGWIMSVGLCNSANVYYVCIHCSASLVLGAGGDQFSEHPDW